MFNYCAGIRSPTNNRRDGHNVERVSVAAMSDRRCASTNNARDEEVMGKGRHCLYPHPSIVSMNESIESINPE